MTVSPCMPIEELAAVVELPGSDPRRVHVATCPRCSALLATYTRFIEPGAAPDAPHVDAADALLSEFLARTIGVPTAAATRPVPATVRARPRPETRKPWWAALFAPAMRPALGFVVAAIVIGGVLVWPRMVTHGPTDTVRGGTPDANVPKVRIEEAMISREELFVKWEAVEGADDYEVRIYSRSLAELATLKTGGPSATLNRPRSELPFEPVAGEPMLVQVEARWRGEVIALSAPVPLRVVQNPD